MAWARASVLRHVALAAALCAVALLLVGRFVPYAIDRALHQAILANIVWRPDSPPEVDARYRGLPDPNGVPDYFRVWLFNITNLPDVRKGAKPKMAEVGPLTYIKHRVKADTWWDRRGRVAVKEWDYHVFQPHLSAASPNDTIVTLNLPLVGVLEVLHAYSASVPGVRPLLDVLVGVLSGWRDDHVDGLFTRRTAGELLWGYEDLLLKRLSLLLGSTFVRSSTVQLLRNDTAEYALASQANIIDTGWRPAAAAAGPGEQGGGGDGWRQRDEYDEQMIWNMEVESGWNNVTSWAANCSEQVRGTDAFQFQPGLDRDSVPRVWITELFRSAALKHLADVELYGVQLLRFIPDPQEAEPEPCHYQRIRGLANVTVPSAVGPNGNASSDAAHGVPLYMSLPHYCLVDDSVSAAVEGLTCDPELHGIFIDVEPTTGITMRAAKRLQLSSELTHSARTTLEPTIGTSIILPIFWAEEASEISVVQAANFRGGVYRAQRIRAAVAAWSYPLAAAAAAAAAGGLAAALMAVRARTESDDGTHTTGGGRSGGGGDVRPSGPTGENGSAGAARPRPLARPPGWAAEEASLEPGASGRAAHGAEGGGSGDLEAPLLGVRQGVEEQG